MESHRSRFLLFFLFNSLIKPFTITSGDRSAFIKCYCSEAGNYTIDSPFKENLILALSYLPSNTSLNNGFYNVSVGQTSDIVYAISYCRGDVLSDTCKGCVQDSVEEIFHCCPNQMEAFGFYDYCALRYSNRYIFGVLETQPHFNWSSEVIVNNTNQFEQELESLLRRLVAEAAWQSPGKKFAVGQLDMTYALVQCSEDLSSLNCSICLDSATTDILNLYGWETGAQIHMPSCNTRFEGYKFYISTPGVQPTSNAPPPPPTNFNNSTGKGGSKIWVKVVIGVVAGAGGLLAVLILVWLRSRPCIDNTGTANHTANPNQNGVAMPPENPDCVVNGPGRGSEPQLYENGITVAKENPPSEPDEVGGVLEAQQSGNHVIAGAPQQFQLSTIKSATNDFSEANVLGQGAYGVVYKATLPDGQEIAVKRLKPRSCDDDEFRNELSVLAKLQHENLVKFLGFCLEGTEKILVFEYVKNGSLGQFIFDSGHRPQWETLYSFILGIVQGLLYLHGDSGLGIIHRDIKPANILLDENMIPKIADFGMAKLFREDQTHCESSKIKGTLRYLAPEYANCRRCSRRSDVYSFGVVLLEIVSGRRNNSADPGVHLLSCAWISLMNDRVSDVFHPSMILEANPLAIDQIRQCIHIGLLCVQANEAQRPRMEQIHEWLNDYSIQLLPPSKPPYFVESDSDVQSAAPMIVVASSTTSSTSAYQSLPSQ